MQVPAHSGERYIFAVPAPGKTKSTIKITAFCYFQQDTAGALPVFRAQTARMGALFIFSLRNFRQIAAPCFQVTQPAPDNGGKISVLRAGFLQVNSIAVGGMDCRNALQADRADTVSLSDNFAHGWLPFRMLNTAGPVRVIGAAVSFAHFVGGVLAANITVFFTGRKTV